MIIMHVSSLVLTEGRILLCGFTLQTGKINRKEDMTAPFRCRVNVTLKTAIRALPL